ncbi:MAG: tetratricopeptide repeat protein [Methanomicrobiales archaeon]
MTVKEAVELLKKGLAYAKRTKYNEALSYYNKALSLDPNNPEAWYLRASVLIDTGKSKEALLDCEKAIALDQNYAPAWSKKQWLSITSNSMRRDCMPVHGHLP